MCLNGNHFSLTAEYWHDHVDRVMNNHDEIFLYVPAPKYDQNMHDNVHVNTLITSALREICINRFGQTPRDCHCIIICDNACVFDTNRYRVVRKC